jgi:hypothetical protein
MAAEQTTLRDWHRLLGLLLTDFFAGSSFTVEVERDLPVQQQSLHVVIPNPGPLRASIVRRTVQHPLDMVIVRRGPGRFAGRLPDGLKGLVAHNLITFKSHHEALDAWAVTELVAHYVAYRKAVSPSPAELLPEDQFRLFAVCENRPQKLPREVPWQERGPGVYDCLWGTDTVRVVVTGEVSRQPHNALRHLFSAVPDRVGFSGGAYRRRSTDADALLDQVFERYHQEGLAVGYTMPDFRRDYIKEYLPELPREDREDVLRALPAEDLLAVLSLEQIRQYLDRATAGHKAGVSKPRRKK